MAMGAGKKGQKKPLKSKPASSYKVRSAVPPPSKPAGSGKATMQLRIAAYALVACPAALMALVIGYIVWGTA